jgi:methyl-accepting chemotaxis protein
MEEKGKGQGFVVIAQEMGELVERLGMTTQEIEEMVSKVQRETYDLMTEMQQRRSQAELPPLADTAKQGLRQILELAHQLDPVVQAIYQTAEAQIQALQVVAGLLQTNIDTAEQSAKDIQQRVRSLQQTNEMTQRLQDAVSGFKVGAEVIPLQPNWDQVN